MLNAKCLAKRRRLILLLLIIVIAAWTGLWITTSRRFDKQIEAWAAAERKAKHSLSYDEGRSGGSPWSVSRRFHNVKWKDGKDWDARIEALTLTARLWCWRSLGADFQNAMLATPYLPDSSGPLTFRTDSGFLGLAWNGAGEWTAAETSLSGLKLSRDTTELASIETLAMETDRPRPALKDHKKTGMNFSATAKNMGIKTKKPQPFGDAIAQAELKLRVMGDPPDAAEKESLRAWNEASGVVEIDDLTLDWNQLKLEMKGTLALNNDLQPEGAFSAKIKNRETVAKALVDTGWAALNDVELLNAALNLDPQKRRLFAKDVVPLSVQEGALFIGPVRSIAIPPITWPEK